MVGRVTQGGENKKRREENKWSNKYGRMGKREKRRSDGGRKNEQEIRFELLRGRGEERGGEEKSKG